MRFKNENKILLLIVSLFMFMLFSYLSITKINAAPASTKSINHTRTAGINCNNCEIEEIEIGEVLNYIEISYLPGNDNDIRTIEFLKRPQTQQEKNSSYLPRFEPGDYKIDARGLLNFWNFKINYSEYSTSANYIPLEFYKTRATLKPDGNVYAYFTAEQPFTLQISPKSVQRGKKQAYKFIFYELLEFIQMDIESSGSLVTLSSIDRKFSATPDNNDEYIFSFKKGIRETLFPAGKYNISFDYNIGSLQGDGGFAYQRMIFKNHDGESITKNLDYNHNGEGTINFDIIIPFNFYGIINNKIKNMLPQGIPVDLIKDIDFILIADLYPPVIDNDFNGLFIVDVDNAVSVETIKSHLTAVDETDGDVTNRIVIESDDYTQNKDVLGFYDVVFSVSDLSDNKSYLTITVNVRDLTKPVITGVSAFSSKISSPMKESLVRVNVYANDNYDGKITEAIELIEDNFTPNKHKVGSFTIIYQVTDSSGNISDPFTVTITSKDDIPPVITGDNNFSVSTQVVLKVDFIKAKLNAIDGIDGTTNIVVESNNYTGKENKVGNYEIVFSSTDKAGNKATYTVTIEVFDNIAPVFYTSDKIINLNLYNVLTEEQIKELIIYLGLIDTTNIVNLAIVQNNINPERIGTYSVTLLASYINGEEIELETSFNVIDLLAYETSDIENEDAVDGFFNKVWNTIKMFYFKIINFFNKIIDFFRWLF